VCTGLVLLQLLERHQLLPRSVRVLWGLASPTSSGPGYGGGPVGQPSLGRTGDPFVSLSCHLGSVRVLPFEVRSTKGLRLLPPFMREVRAKSGYWAPLHIPPFFLPPFGVLFALGGHWYLTLGNPLLALRVGLLHLGRNPWA